MEKLSTIHDKELVALTKKGSRHAFGELYTRYYDPLLYYCRQYLNDTSGAEDTVQEIFLQLWETRDSLNVDLSFSGYVHTLTRNRILYKFRQFDIHSRYAQQILINAQEASNETEDSILDNDYAALLNEWIEKLSPKQKEVFKLSRMEGLTYQEIAELLHISVPTVQTHAYLALKKIKEFLKQHTDIHFQDVIVILILFSLFL